MEDPAENPTGSTVAFGGWRTEASLSQVLSLGVFGNRGDRFSLVVIPVDALPGSGPGGEVEWSLLGPAESGRERVLFALQWTMEVRGSGCLALCGRELPVFPVRPA